MKLRKLWASVTGESYPEHYKYGAAEKVSIGRLSKKGNVIKSEAANLQLYIVYDNRRSMINDKADDVLQAEKRLVPSGPDPLHHSSQPLSP